MGIRITDKLVNELAHPKVGNRVVYDDRKAGVGGFGIRVTASGAKSWVLNYRNSDGRERRHTLGAFPAIKTEAARKAAGKLLGEIKLNGSDPQAKKKAALAAPRMNDLCDYYIEHHLPEKRSASAADDKAMIASYIRPKLGSELVSAIDKPILARLHRGMSAETPYRANRVMALLSKMFAMACDDLKWRATNPTKGVKRNIEAKRERYLTGAEIVRLMQVLTEFEDQTVANIVRLLLLTGARRGEILQAKWSQFDLGSHVWTKPAATTKQNKEHRVTLSDDAGTLIDQIHASAARKEDGKLASPYVFPAPLSGKPRTEIKDEWRVIALAAGLYDELPPAKEGGKSVKVVNCRIHDLRHTFASLLASRGLSLLTIGKLLGHTNPNTTHRYAHLADDPLREAANMVGALVTGKKAADVVSIGERVA